MINRYENNLLHQQSMDSKMSENAEIINISITSNIAEKNSMLKSQKKCEKVERVKFSQFKPKLGHSSTKKLKVLDYPPDSPRSYHYMPSPQEDNRTVSQA